MTAINGRRFAFYAKRYSKKKASIRLRVLEPILALREAGVDVGRYPRLKSPDGYDAVIISKAFGRGARKAIKAARQAGCGLIFDICDNRFANNRVKNAPHHGQRTSSLLSQADLVTVPTERMGQLLLASTPQIAGRVRVVPDMLEDLSSLGTLRLSLIERHRLSRLRAFLAAHPGTLHCVWFGNNMAGVSGVGLLDDAMAQLRAFAADHPVTLTIINNQPKSYRAAAPGWGIPSFFMPWSLASFPLALRQHRVAIIPVARNDYTLGKSINRPATAIMAGLGVIADSIESYEELRPFIALDDWQAGLARYAHGWESEQPLLAQARDHLDRHYGRRHVAECWRAVLDEVSARPPAP
ncbi:hypothetical protein SAMN05518849_10696 [Sphingobium sp. AP50]|uniref:hypothetical protein n=1 Tax=Sphingobium sp. AP50 TaxID=1884369 RepID=UPI0008BD92F5|nr:hypothetical protein [Sphingobium sp. AP50]SEJ41994.1 hypothetical protein SAMN05518849_10696 [Sphingobium sp. AP50]